jgi:hypothetical protein
VTEIDWPPHAVTMRVLDANGHEVHSTTKIAGPTKEEAVAAARLGHGHEPRGCDGSDVRQDVRRLAQADAEALSPRPPIRA